MFPWNSLQLNGHRPKSSRIVCDIDVGIDPPSPPNPCRN